MLSHPINFQPNPKCHRIHENQPDCSKIQFSMMMALHGNNTRIIFVRSIRPLSPLNNGSCFALYSEEGCGLDFPFWMYWFLSSGKRWIDHPKRGVSFHLQNSRKSSLLFPSFDPFRNWPYSSTWTRLSRQSPRWSVFDQGWVFLGTNRVACAVPTMSLCESGWWKSYFSAWKPPFPRKWKTGLWKEFMVRSPLH